MAISLAGLSATYPGYMSAEEQASKTEKNQSEAREAAMKLIGAQAYGNVLAGNNLSQGPQAPPPGQPSMPSAPPPRFGGPPDGAPQSGMGAAPPQGGPPAGAPLPPPAPQQPLSPVAGGAPAAPPTPVAGPVPVPQTGLPKELDLHTLAQALIQHNPPGMFQRNPELLFWALDAAKGHLTEQGQQDLAELRHQEVMKRLENSDKMLAESARQHDMQNQGRSRAADQRDVREARLASGAQVRQDQAYQRLFMQQQALQAKVAQGNNALDIKKLHETTEAMRNRANAILKANNQFTTLDDEGKKALLDDQNKFYDEQKARIEKVTGVAAPDFGGRFDAARPSGVPSSQPPAAPAPAEVPSAMPKAVMEDYQKALAAGKPKELLIQRLKQSGYPTEGL